MVKPMIKINSVASVGFDVRDHQKVVIIEHFGRPFIFHDSTFETMIKHYLAYKAEIGDYKTLAGGQASSSLAPKSDKPSVK